MRFFLVAGEPSGDFHGGLLVKALLKEQPDAIFEAWGGDNMQAAGVSLKKHVRELAFMGVGAVLKNLRQIFKNFTICQENISAFKPDAIILIDYSGFNLRMARWAKSNGYKVFYYISPQVWASRASRVKQIADYTDRLFSILPFEQDFYAARGIEITYVGHPLLDVIPENINKPNSKPIIALLPGSRRQEVSKLLQVMLSVLPQYPDYDFELAVAPNLPLSFYQAIMNGLPDANRLKLVQQDTYSVLRRAKAALVCSGTATLETALHGVPQVVCYKTDTLFYEIAKRVVKVPFIAIINLIMGKKIVEELIQNDCNTERLKKELDLILHPEVATRIQADYKALRQKLGNSGATERAAKEMIERLK